ncbi:MAG: hypothetical protein LUI07_09995 [Lachnospiraceae bacterium]|nr:hypothetical protein [Lachnospiraceae bacterium]
MSLDEEMQTERDFRMLQGMYPETAKTLLPYIEEACDRMEYEGSAMYDEYPDYTTLYTLQEKIAEAAVAPVSACSGTGGDLGDIPPSDKGKDGADRMHNDLIRVMLLQEMHRRRTRHRFYR